MFFYPIKNRAINIAKKTAILGVMPPLGIALAYGIMTLIEQIAKLSDPEFQLKGLQGFPEFVQSDSLKLAAEIYGSVMGGIILIALLTYAYAISRSYTVETPITQAGDKEATGNNYF